MPQSIGAYWIGGMAFMTTCLRHKWSNLCNLSPWSPLIWKLLCMQYLCCEIYGLITYTIVRESSEMYSHVNNQKYENYICEEYLSVFHWQIIAPHHPTAKGRDCIALIKYFFKIISYEIGLLN